MDPLLKSTRDPDERAPGQVNWFICGVLLLIFGPLALWLVGLNGLIAWSPAAELGNISMVLFHGLIAACATFALGCNYIDTIPMLAKYRVPGQPSIPVVQHAFVHSGRWTTFTVWCNTLAMLYFWLVTAACVLKLRNGQEELPRALLLTLGVLWDISFPMGFLVNMVVSFVLLPQAKREGEFQKVWYMLKWRGQSFHNGYVLAVSLEAVVVSPGIPLMSFPVIVLYGIAYVVFSYLMFAKLGLFHYFFLDPRWKFAPLGLVGLLVLLTGLFLAGSVAMSGVSQSWWAKCVVMLAALATCTFRDSAAVAPDEPSSAIA